MLSTYLNVSTYLSTKIRGIRSTNGGWDAYIFSLVFASNYEGKIKRFINGVNNIIKT